VANVLAFERQIAESLLTVLQPRMTQAVALTALPTNDPEAYDLYLKGRYLWNQAPRTRDTLEQSLVYYRAALERDPQFALAHSGIAMAYVNMANFGYLPPHEALARAALAVERAIALDSSLADAYTARGFVLAARGALPEAEASLRRAITLNPDLPWAHHFYALLLTMTGRTTEAIDETRRTLAIDPLSLPGNTMLGIEFATEGNLPEARVQLRRALELSPGFPLTRYYLGTVEAALGNGDAAREMLEGALATSPGFPGVRAVLAQVYTGLGLTAKARRLVADVRSAVVDERTRVTYALALAVLGRADSAFAMLQKAQWDIPTLIELRSNPLLKDFRSDPRYAELLDRWSLRP
jgi:tetratricopeptide (TPR) repeat protein